MSDGRGTAAVRASEVGSSPWRMLLVRSSTRGGLWPSPLGDAPAVMGLDLWALNSVPRPSLRERAVLRATNSSLVQGFRCLFRNPTWQIRDLERDKSTVLLRPDGRPITEFASRVRAVWGVTLRVRAAQQIC